MFTFVILPVKYGRAFRHARQLVGKPVPVIPGSAPKGTCVAAGRRPYKQFAVLIRRAGCPHPAAQNAKAPAISGGLRAGHPTRCKDMPLQGCGAQGGHSRPPLRNGTSGTPSPTNDRLFRQTGGRTFRHAHLRLSKKSQAVKKVCHCEPVRRLAWQSVSKTHNSRTFPQIPS